MTTVVKRIRKALLRDIHDAEGSLRDALTELAISGGGSGEHIVRRIRHEIFHASSANSETNLRAALADLEIAGAGSGRRIIQRIREAIFESRREEESDLRKALFDLLGGGGGSYHADAVHWDGMSSLRNPALNCGDHDTISVALWFKTSPTPPPSTTFIGGFFVTDPQGNFGNYAEVDTAGPPNEASDGVQFNIADPNGSFLASSSTGGGQGTPPPVNTWAAYMYSADVSSNVGPLTAFLGDVDAIGSSQNNSPGGVSIEGNGVPLWVGVADPNGNSPYDMANLLMWYGQAIDWSVEADRRFIIDASGKAADPALAIAHFGTPTVAFIGGATAFQTNQGDGGVFTLSGSLTDASTSPSD